MSRLEHCGEKGLNLHDHAPGPAVPGCAACAGYGPLTAPITPAELAEWRGLWRARPRRGPWSTDNAAFIAAAREALPRLLDEVERLGDALERTEYVLNTTVERALANNDAAWDAKWDAHCKLRHQSTDALARRVEAAERERDEARAEVEILRRAFAHVSDGACIMDAPDGPVCWCGRPSYVEAGLCRDHGAAEPAKDGG